MAMPWSDESWDERDHTWQEGDGRYGCLVALAFVGLLAWMLVTMAVD